MQTEDIIQDLQTLTLCAEQSSRPPQPHGAATRAVTHGGSTVEDHAASPF